MRNMQEAISVAMGKHTPDLVLKNASYVNVFTGEIDHGDIAIHEGYIVAIGAYSGKEEINLAAKFLLPGFIDSHIHLESSLVMPQEFANAVIAHGTTTVVTDPHEIANVLGTSGIDFILEATENLPIDVAVMLPSCVPATPLDESGAVLTAEDLAPYYKHPRVFGLAELMDYSSLLKGSAEVLDKVEGARKHHCVLDGHAPFLTGRSLQAYLTAGVGSDHECVHLWEAKEKLRYGQHIMIREGTAARNLAALAPLITEKTVHRCMFCSDDKHPNHLMEEGHIDQLVKKAVSLGIDPILAVQASSYSAAQYFGMKDKGAIAPNYLADLVVVDNLHNFKVELVLKQGTQVYNTRANAPIELPSPTISPELLSMAENSVHLEPCTAETFHNEESCGVLGVVPGEILTTHCSVANAINLSQDIVKLCVLERHKGTGHRGIGFLQGYGLKEGAIATSIAHDSHNIIVVGVSEEEMSFAVNALIEMQGGIVVVKDRKVTAKLPLPIGGIMSKEPLATVNQTLEEAKQVTYAQGVSQEIDPFMTLSFLSLPVIPTLRLTTKGVFDVISGEYLSTHKPPNSLF